MSVNFLSKVRPRDVRQSGIDELKIDAYLVVRLLDAAFKNVQTQSCFAISRRVRWSTLLKDAVEVRGDHFGEIRDLRQGGVGLILKSFRES